MKEFYPWIFKMRKSMTFLIKVFCVRLIFKHVKTRPTGVGNYFWINSFIMISVNVASMKKMRRLTVLTFLFFEGGNSVISNYSNWSCILQNTMQRFCAVRLRSNLTAALSISFPYNHTAPRPLLSPQRHRPFSIYISSVFTCFQHAFEAWPLSRIVWHQESYCRETVDSCWQ
jgi:hypothetical protein